MPARDLPQTLAQVPAYISFIDARGRLRWCNRTSYGLSDDDLVGLPSDQFIVEEDRPRWASYLHRVFHCREVVRYSLYFQAPTGLVRLVGKIAPVVIDGQVRWAAVITFDATHTDPTPCEGCPVACQPTVHPITPPAPTPGRGRWLSPLEEKVLSVLTGKDWTPAERVAALVGESNGGDLRAVLRNMVERELLESAPSRGYRLVPA